MDAGQTTATARAIDPVERDVQAPIDRELGEAYTEIATLSDLVHELDRRTKAVQAEDRGDFASPTEDRPAPAELSPVARAVREQHDQVAQINNHLRTILAALQT